MHAMTPVAWYPNEAPPSTPQSLALKLFLQADGDSL